MVRPRSAFTTPIFTPVMGARLRRVRHFRCPIHWHGKTRAEKRIKPKCTCIKADELAKKLGVSRQTLNRIEQGLIEVSKAPTKAFEDALKPVQFEYIFRGMHRNLFEELVALGDHGHDVSGTFVNESEPYAHGVDRLKESTEDYVNQQERERFERKHGR